MKFCFVYQNGSGKHINNIQLGANGRNRSNVWQYEGMNVSTKQANKLRQLHPTVKPVPMLVDIMLDASLPGDIVLDCFGGSGTKRRTDLNIIMTRMAIADSPFKASLQKK